MTVEFLEPDERPEEATDAVDASGPVDAGDVRDAAGPPPAPVEPARGWVRVADIGLTIVGVALVVAACFRTVYSVALGSQFSVRDYSVDGWGRIVDPVVAPGNQHAARFGIMLCLAAGLALLASGWRALRRTSAGLGRAADLASTAAVVAVAATIGFGVLDGLALLDNYRAAVAIEQLDPSSNGLARRELAIGFGGFVWLAAAGAGCIALAAALSHLARFAAGRRARRHAREQPVPVVAVNESDELL